MAGFTVLTEENSDGTKTTYRVSRWRFYCPIIIFIVGVTVMGLVMGLVVIPGTEREGKERAAANKKEFDEIAAENHKKFEEAAKESDRKFEMTSKRNDCYFNCPYGSCMVLCDLRDIACKEKCGKDKEACEHNCDKLYPA